jgi:hypothetical protein
MCGLFGFATNKSVKHLGGAFLVLAMENQTRGRDSWGVCDGRDLRIIKHLGNIERQWHKIPIRDKGILMGHVRAATVGGNTQPNAHPFEFKAKHHVIGAHNGHISNWKELNQRYERSLEVDSMQIFAHIAEERPMDELEGAGAITFIKDGGLYLSRFNNGSLSIAQLLDADKQPIGIAWSSLEMDLKLALDGSGINYETYKVEEGRIYFWDNNALSVSKNQKMTICSYSNRVQVTDHRHFHGNTVPFRGHNNSTGTEKRIIRLRVCRNLREDAVAKTGVAQSTTEATTPPVTLDDQAQQVEAMKIKVHEAGLLIDSGKSGFCERCGLTTPKRLSDAKALCLPCAAKMVLKGELLLPAAAEQKVDA